ncbi:Cyclin pch1 [Spathaspora sp. JA1]|nr:Cyclin pch1 [Spathaspora sp. JA1]
MSQQASSIPNQGEIGPETSVITPPDIPPAHDETWIFEETAFLNHSPSRNQKMTIPQELKAKESIHDFIIRLGSKLKLDARTILSATIYLHRFYMRLPITSSKYYVASAGITISCKLNDTYRQPDKIALQACNLKNTSSSPIDEQSDMFWRWRDQLLYREELILKALNFDLNIESPYDIRDRLLEHEEEEEEEVDNKKKIDSVLRNSVTLIETLSSLPILVCYDINTLYATALLITLLEYKLKGEDITLPKRYLVDQVGVELQACVKCFLFIKKLLKYSQQDQHYISNKVAARRILSIPTVEFEQVITNMEEEK